MTGSERSGDPEDGAAAWNTLFFKLTVEGCRAGLAWLFAR
ncbi:hypothetical protein SAMN04488057_12053 [Cyclobacterium lianum]|uniref:Uncharacterized protein n=1 Tax=Cyclobacterium lianum TaxID=388280 RepID=A0A1M7QN20_9BACT|nr:hypothetical protein SAMN04488057_12053 [Cyclobacterium lianum]